MASPVRMKAITRTKYGPPDVLEPKEVDKPTPTDKEVLVRIGATSINKSDWYDLDPPLFFRLVLMRRLKPESEMMLSDMAGTVESVGKDVTQFLPGDEVFGNARGALAEYACAREDRLALKPPNLTFEEAAAVPVAAYTALQCLRDKGEVKPGRKVMIYGANGGVGTFAVQIAKALGAEVTAVTSPGNLDSARSMGADHVIDYSREDFTKNGQKYDVIIAVNGHRSVFAFSSALRPNGIFVLIGSDKIIRSLLQSFILGPLISRTRGKRTKFMIAKPNQPDLIVLKEMLESGKVRPKVAKIYPFDEAIDAFRHFGEGHSAGKVVIEVS